MPAGDESEDVDDEQTGGSRLTVGLEARHTRALEQSMHRRDDAMSRLENITSTSRTVDVSSSDDVASPPEVGRRSEASTRRARYTDVSGLDLDDSMFGDLDLEESIVAGDETRSGLHSTETSSLNVAAFRRRPRVSSIVGKDDAPIRPSSRGPNTPGISSTINFGNFKRRQREPSILGTARKHRSRSRQPLASEDESGDEREGTRLGRAFSRQRSTRQASVAPSQGESRAVSPARETRKRKSLEEQGGSAQKRTAMECEVEAHDSIEIDDGMDSDEDDSVLSSLPTTPPRGVTPDPNDPDLAPPASIASSDDSPPAQANWESLAHRNYHHKRPASRAQKTPELGADASDISSPPSLTHSPNYAAPPPKRAPRGRARKREPEPAPKVTTAELASLLPRRRHKHPNNDPYNISSDAEEEALTFDNDDDELSYAHPRATRTKRSTKPLRNASKSKAKGKQPATGKGAKRTYGSKTSDKENDEEDSIVVGGNGDGEEATPDEESSQEMLERMGEELKNAAKKFKEVDKWELAFEEVTEPSSEAA